MVRASGVGEAEQGGCAWYRPMGCSGAFGAAAGSWPAARSPLWPTRPNGSSGRPAPGWTRSGRSVTEGPLDPGHGAPATPAATVVPLRDGDEGLEVLLLRRASGGVFGGVGGL